MLNEENQYKQVSEWIRGITEGPDSENNACLVRLCQVMTAPVFCSLQEQERPWNDSQPTKGTVYLHGYRIHNIPIGSHNTSNLSYELYI